MAMANARNQYLKTQIETASKEQLVVMLFDGIIRFTEQARKAIEGGQIEDSHHSLMRAQAIIMELICTIDKDKGGDVANNLMSLHAYAFNCLIVCNMKKDVSKIDEVQKIYRDLREAWVGAMDSLGITSQAGKPVPPAPGPAGQPAPAQPAAPAAAKPATSAINPGIMAAAAAVPQAGISQPAPAPAAPASGYGLGKSAMLNAMLAKKATATAQSAAPAQSAQAGAMLNAYTGTRSIA